MTTADAPGRQILVEKLLQTVIERDASEHAILDLFDIMSGESKDGAKTPVTGHIEFVRDDHRDTYRFEIKQAYMSEWTLTNPSSATAPTIETFKLTVEEMEYQLGRETAVYAVPTFKKR